jgi:hypothetical protein
MSWEKFMVIGCTHGNHICPDAEAAARRFMNKWKPKHRAHLGDVWDFAGIRKGASPEERMEGIKADYQAGMATLAWFKPQLLTMGNHDYRIWRVAKECSNGIMADMASMFCDDIETELRRRRIKWVPSAVDQYLQFPCGGPKLLHGYRATMYPAKAHFENWGDCITAHVHKPDTHEARHVDGGTAHCIGTLADLKKLSYADHTPAKLAWRNSFGYGMINSKTGKWQMYHVIKQGGEWVSPLGII